MPAFEVCQHVQPHAVLVASLGPFGRGLGRGGAQEISRKGQAHPTLGKLGVFVVLTVPLFG